MIEVLRAGMHTTVQDMGRYGARRYGVAVAGAMDPHAARVANALAGNTDTAALLECTIAGPRLRLTRDCLCAVTGHAPTILLDGAPVRAGLALSAAAGSTIDVRDTGRGARACIAFHGGIDVPVVLASRATDCTAGFGGWNGRALADGDVLALGTPADGDAMRQAGAAAGRSMLPAYAEEPVLRVLRGPDRCADDVWNVLVSAPFTVGANSNRMGCRLHGPALHTGTAGMMISAPVAPGTVQLPPDGHPIVLMADAQTIGGYPRIASVISVDLPVLAQVRPGRAARFVECTIGEAHALLAARERDFRMLRAALQLRA